ncbi:hypothetical protein SEA_GODONK_224 [Gordonia phage GodonK]|uniref:Uncharacterized protein n=1 Tax=Gordonia phage GodonK TaxID=2562192 RepID=A0A4D6E450_9CAUD|nr:hypothetical protein HOV33_gp144 [Gordonia phage GodonK]QBZ72812.1 hypothetical protein SEA_GODONK_224 [Gordonia phage GodonK]
MMSDLLDMALKRIQTETRASRMVTPLNLQIYLATREQKVYGKLTVEPSPNNLLVARASKEFVELMVELIDHPNVNFEPVRFIELAMADEYVYNMPEVTNPGYPYKTEHWLPAQMRWVK